MLEFLIKKVHNLDREFAVRCQLLQDGWGVSLQELESFLESIDGDSVGNCKCLEHFCGGIKLNHELVGCLGQEELVFCEASEGCFLQILFPEDSECLVVFLGPIVGRETFFWREHEEGEPTRG